MGRGPTDIYTLPSTYLATVGEKVLASQHNGPLEDIAADLNTARPISAGGTGATTVSGAMGALGINTRFGVGTKAALKALSAGAYETVFVKGATADNDGGQGWFVWVSGDQSTAVTNDPGSGVWVPPNVDVTGATGAWKRFGPILTPEMFGAKGDGTTDDSTALQRWVNFLIYDGREYGEASPGSTYLCDSVLVTATAPLVLDGKGAKLKIKSGTVDYMLAVNGEHTTICNWRFEGDSDTLSTYDASNLHTLLKFTASSFGRAHNCWFTKWRMHAIRALSLDGSTYSEGVQIDHCWFYGAPWYVSNDPQAAIQFAANGEYSQISHCYFYDVPAAMRFTDGANCHVSNIIAMKCTLDNATVGRAIIYAESNSNSGKISFDQIKINHIETQAYCMLLKGDATKPQNPFKLSNIEIIASGDVTNAQLLTLNDAPSSVLSNIHLRPDSSNVSPCARFNDCDNIMISNIFTQDGTYGLYFNNCSPAHVTNYQIKDANTADIFETGTTKVYLNGVNKKTFTPTVQFATAGDSLFTYNQQDGVYWETDDYVEASVYLDFDINAYTTASGAFTIECAGLPANAGTDLDVYPVTLARLANVTFSSSDLLCAQMVAGGKSISLRTVATNAAGADLTTTNFPASKTGVILQVNVRYAK